MLLNNYPVLPFIVFGADFDPEHGVGALFIQSPRLKLLHFEYARLLRIRIRKAANWWLWFDPEGLTQNIQIPQ